MTKYYIETTKTHINVRKFTNNHSKLLASYERYPNGHQQARELINQFENKTTSSLLREEERHLQV